MKARLFPFKPQIHWLVVFIIALVICINAISERRYAHNFVMQWDANGYSMYATTLVLQKDFKHPDYLDTIDVVYHPASPGYGRHKLTNGNTVFKYTCGNSIMTLPFFYLGHLKAKLQGLPEDGRSMPYQEAIVIATVFWSILGLIFLTLALRQRFSPAATAITLAMIGLGTNFFYYASYETGFSHPLNFFWFAVAIWAATAWLRNHRWIHSIVLGIAVGFIGLVRPTDLVLGIFLAVLFIASLTREQSAKQRWHLFSQAIVAVLIALMIFSIQLLYWKWVSGNWLVDSYKGEHFDFSDPHILDGLFSYKKGWFVYTPVALFATIGIAVAYRHDPWMAIGIASFLILNVYITFSWESWWYGGGFGARPMIQSLALLAFPLAALVEAIRVRWKGKPYLLVPSAIVGISLVALNLFQSYQYDHTVLHWERMSKESYWKTFGRTRISPEEFRQLYGE